MRNLIYSFLFLSLCGCSPVVETSEEFPIHAVFSEQNAIAYLDKIIDHDPDNAEALFQRAKLGFVVGDALKAKEYIVRALEGASENPDYLFLKAKIDEALGQHSEAIQTIEKLRKVKDFVNTTDFELFASDVYLKTKTYNLANYYLQSAAEKLPANIEVLYQRAKLYAATFDTTKAISFYKSVLVQDSLHEPALLNLSELFFKNKQVDSTLYYLGRLPKLHSLHYHLILGEALREKSLADSAAKHWEAALLLSPRNAFAQFELGKYYYSKNDFEMANKHMSAVAENERNKLPGFYLLFVKVNEKLGNVEIAVGMFHKQNLADTALLTSPKPTPVRVRKPRPKPVTDTLKPEIPLPN